MCKNRRVREEMHGINTERKDQDLAMITSSPFRAMQEGMRARRRS